MYHNLLLTFLLLATTCPAQTISHIEPPNWWTDMKDNHLQLMLHGENIGHLTASSKSKGIKIQRSICPDNPNYLFVDLTISGKAKPGVILFSLMDNKREVRTIEYPLLAREPGSANRKGYDTEDVIYLITPDRFANGNPSNDDVPEMKERPDRSAKSGRHGGDIEGMRQHLDYIADMGYTAIWPNPVLENDMPRYSYHGYATTDFYKMDPRMGSNETFKAFCREANQKGIKIIKDIILNHCGSHHWWMTDPPTNDWINYYNQPYTETNHRKTIQMDPYATVEDLDILENGWFVRTMPDLNVRNPWMATYLIQNSIWWIEYAGISGVRVDTYLYPDKYFMAEWSRRMMAEYSRLNITGEVWYDVPAIVAYWQKGKTNTDGYVSHLPSLFDFPLLYALHKALLTPDTWDSGWVYLYEALAQDFQYADPRQLVVFADNHDMTRLYTTLGEHIAKWKMAMAYILSTRGIPQIYYGTEILMTSPVQRDDGLIRSDFPGGWSGDPINAFTGEGLTAEQTEAKDFLKHMLQWRKKASAIHHGNTTHFVPRDGVYVLFRQDAQQKVMIILNKNEAPFSLALDRFRRVLGHAIIGKEIISGNTIELQNEIHLEGPGPMIIEFK